MTTPAPNLPPIMPRDVTPDLPPDLPPAPPPEVISPAATNESAAMDAAVAQTRILPPWIWITGLLLLIAVILAIALVS